MENEKKSTRKPWETRWSKWNQKRKWKMRKWELKEFWVDYLKIWIYNLEKIIDLWLSVNSDVYYYDDNTKLTFTPNNKYNYYLNIQDINTNINLWFFLINKKIKKKWDIILNNYLEITWSWLILNNLEYYYTIVSHFNIHFDKINRFDIACDYVINTDYFCRNIFLPYITNLSHEPIIRKWKIETLYIWDRSSKNTYRLIRIYNKVIDTIKKKKGFLYDFEKDVDYSRVEIELRRDLCENIDPMNLLNREYLFTIYSRAIHKFKRNFFLKYTFEDFKKNDRALKNQELTQYKKRIKLIEERKKNLQIYWTEFFSTLEKEKFLKSFIQKAKKMLNNWFTLEQIILYLKINLDDDFFKNNLTN